MDFLASKKEIEFNVAEACDYGVNAATILSLLREYSINETEEYYDVELPVEFIALVKSIPWFEPIEFKRIIQKLRDTGKLTIANETERRLLVRKANRPLLRDNAANYKALMRWAMDFEAKPLTKLTLISLAHHAYDDLELNEIKVEAAMESSEISEIDFEKAIAHLVELGVIEIEILNEDQYIHLCFDMEVGK